MDPTQRRILAAEAQRLLTERRSRRFIDSLYPDDGPLRRELYPKHQAFFAAGAEHNERLFLAANRIGKTMGAGGYELALHAMGTYPPWWVGRRFERPVRCWAAGEDTKLVRDTLQTFLLGRAGALGTGLVRGEALGKVIMRGGVPECADTVLVRHASGGWSSITFKSYEMGREAFQADKVDVMLFDEEPPMSVYTEGLTRTLSTTPGEPNGVVMCVFTPLGGMSEVVLSFMPGGRLPGAGGMSAGLAGIPHGV